jgi:hypothetical protein
MTFLEKLEKTSFEEKGDKCWQREGLRMAEKWLFGK